MLAQATDPSFETIVAQDSSSFRCVHKTCVLLRSDHPWHFHPQFELTWIIRSKGTRFVGDSVESYEAHDLVLSGPCLPHCWRNEPGNDAEATAEWIVVQFDPLSFGAGFLDLPETTGIRGLFRDAARGVLFDKALARSLGPRLLALVTQSGIKRLLGLLEILAELAGAERTMLANALYHKRNDVDQSMVERLEMVHQYISDNLSGLISQRTIADRLAMTPSAFSKFFRAATGRTFMSLVKLVRINEACRRLTASEDRITDIALDCGYQHTSYFDAHFQELKGLSPSAYRRRRRVGQDDPVRGRTADVTPL